MDYKIKYSYGIQGIESVSCETQIPYKIKFHPAYDKERIGIEQSHGLTYLEAKNQLRRGKEKMGVEKIPPDLDVTTDIGMKIYQIFAEKRDEI